MARSKKKRIPENRSKKRPTHSFLRRQQEAQKREAAKWEQKKKQLWADYAGILFFGILALVFGGLLPSAWQELRAYHVVAREDWKRTTGTMRTVRSYKSGGRHSSWHLEGAYIYQVDGRQFAGTRLAFNLRVNKAGADSFAYHLQPGTRVTVYYEKGNPGLATLFLPEASNQYSASGFLLLAIAMSLFSAGSVVYCVRSSAHLRRELKKRLLTQTVPVS